MALAGSSAPGRVEPSWLVSAGVVKVGDMAYENYEAHTESGAFGRVCQICTVDESVTWFEDVSQSVIDPLPADSITRAGDAVRTGAR